MIELLGVKKIWLLMHSYPFSLDLSMTILIVSKTVLTSFLTFSTLHSICVTFSTLLLSAILSSFLIEHAYNGKWTNVT